MVLRRQAQPRKRAADVSARSRSDRRRRGNRMGAISTTAQRPARGDPQATGHTVESPRRRAHEGGGSKFWHKLYWKDGPRAQYAPLSHVGRLRARKERLESTE